MCLFVTPRKKIRPTIFVELFNFHGETEKVVMCNIVSLKAF